MNKDTQEITLTGTNTEVVIKLQSEDRKSRDRMFTYNS